MERSIIIGVDGESRQLVEDGRCGLFVEPENHEELAATVLRLYHDRELTKTLGINGKRFVETNYNREALAEKYLKVLLGIFGNHNTTGGAQQ